MYRQLIGLGLLLALLAACGTYEYKGSEYPGNSAPDFTLQSATGETVRLSEQAGNVVLLFFGYTHCPDVCPTTLGVARQVLNGLGNEAARVKFFFVTVDPERDSPANLASYTAHFHPDITALTGEPTALAAVYDAYGIFIEKEMQPDAVSEYSVTHTARVFLIDPQGKLRLSYVFGTPAEDILSDVRYILNLNSE